MTEKVQVEFGADTGKAESGINTIKDRLGQLNEVATKAFAANQIIDFGNKLLELGDKVIEFAAKYAQMGEDINRASQILGLSTDEFQNFAFAVSMAGGNVDGAVQSMARFEKNIGDAARGAGDSAEMFKALGISMKDLQGGNVQEIMYKVADAFAASADGVNKTTIALNIGSRGFAQMIPVLNEGSKGLRELNEQLAQTGSKLTELQVSNFQKTDDYLKILSASFEGLGVTIFDGIRPAVDSMVENLTELVQEINKNIKEGGVWHDVLLGIEVALKLVMTAIQGFIGGLQILYIEVKTALGNIADLFYTLGRISGDALNGNWDKINEDWDAGLKRMEKNTEDAAKRIKEILEKTGAKVDKIWASKEDAKPEKGGAGTLDLPGDPGKGKEAAAERLKIATDEITTEQKLGQLLLNDKKAQLDADVRNNLISEQEKFAILTEYANAEYQLQKEAIEKEMALDGLKESQKRKLKNQELILEKQHQNQISNIQRQAQMAEMQRYRQVFAAIDSSFKGMIQGILQGTQTWQQGLANMFSNILVSFAGMLEEMAMKWVENQIMQAIFGRTTTTGIISGHAAEGAAAAYASTAAIPVVGPALAPGVAAQAYGAIMAFNALPSFDVGTDFVEKDMPANIHKGERIMTAGENNTFTKALNAMNSQGAGGGGGKAESAAPIHLHLHAMDGQSAKKFLIDNKDAVAASLRAAARGGSKDVAHLMKA